MTRTALIFSLLSLASGCAAIDGNFTGATPANQPASSGSKELAYEPMSVMPPVPVKEDVPQLGQGEVWVPGYYQPVAGNWLWHQGSVQPLKHGYNLVPASYREEGGKIYFTPPRWRRGDLVPKK